MLESGSNDTPGGVVASAPPISDKQLSAVDQITGDDAVGSTPNAQVDTDHPSGTQEESGKIYVNVNDRVLDATIAAANQIFVAVTGEDGTPKVIVYKGVIFVPKSDNAKVIVEHTKEEFNPKVPDEEPEDENSQRFDTNRRRQLPDDLCFGEQQNTNSRWRIPRIIINGRHAKNTDRILEDLDPQLSAKQVDEYFATLDPCTSDSSDSEPWAQTSPETQAGTVQQLPSTTEQ